MNEEFRLTVSVTANQMITLPATSTDNDFQIDWGDTNTETVTTVSPTHTYTTAGSYQIRITGLMPLFAFNNEGDREIVDSLDQMGDTGLLSMEGFMYGCTNLTSINLNNFGAPPSMRVAFMNCTSLATVVVKSLNTSRVVTFPILFFSLVALLPVSIPACGI